MKGFDALSLGILLAQFVINNATIGIGFQSVTEKRRKTELAHQRLGKFIEGVRQNNNLEALAQPVDEFTCAWHRCHGRNHCLNIV